MTARSSESDDRPDAALSVRLSGPNVTEQDVLEVGEQMNELIRLVGAEMTGKDDLPPLFKVGPAVRVCDGCGIHAPAFALPDDWRNEGADDLCPACIAAKDAG